MKKKVIAISVVCVLLLIAFIGIGYYRGFIGIPSQIEELFGQHKDIYTLNNNSQFKAKEINGKLSPSEYNFGASSNGVMLGNIFVNVPTPDIPIYSTYSDTVFAEDGSFYIVITENPNTKEDNSEMEIKRHKLGKGEPVVFDITIPNTNKSLYIQCYDPATLGFYDDIEFESSLSIDKLPLDYKAMSNSQLAKNSYAFPKEIKVKEVKPSIDFAPTLIESLKSNPDKAGTPKFAFGDNSVYVYKREVGNIYEKQVIESTRLGYFGKTPTKVGSYYGYATVEFDNGSFYLMYYPITSNSHYVVYVSVGV